MSWPRGAPEGAPEPRVPRARPPPRRGARATGPRRSAPRAAPPEPPRGGCAPVRRRARRTPRAPDRAIGRAPRRAGARPPPDRRPRRRCPLPLQPLEPVQVHAFRVDLERISGRSGEEHPVGQHLAQARHVDLHHLGGRLRRLLPPQVVQEPLHRHDTARLEKQPSEQRALFSRPEEIAPPPPLPSSGPRTRSPFAVDTNSGSRSSR